MKSRTTTAWAVGMALTLASGAANAASLITFGNPWGQKATLDAAMDLAFGPGTWSDVGSPADASGLIADDFLYFEGGDDTAEELETFLTANAAALLAYLTNGGRMFINAAPNEGDGYTAGGIGIVYDQTEFCGVDCNAVDPAHPIFTSVVTSYGGGWFSHGYVIGGTPLIENAATGNALLAEFSVGLGAGLIGTMTTTNFHGEADALQLRANILQYAAFGEISTPQIPLPAALPLLAAGLGGLSVLRLRRKAA